MLANTLPARFREQKHKQKQTDRDQKVIRGETRPSRYISEQKGIKEFLNGADGLHRRAGVDDASSSCPSLRWRLPQMLSRGCLAY
eukprot:736612-Amorphochlora_amoeboformis.AAC.1